MHNTNQISCTTNRILGSLLFFTILELILIINQIRHEIMKYTDTSNVTISDLGRLIIELTLVSCQEISAFTGEGAYFWTTIISIYV